ncbi:hypothetical protein C8R43DRAFT_941502 [Mycena crocata]|nr:hypothetical protein C8R43DRAFT_941502 [Mycena crocata]
MSVATKNPFALLEAEDSSRPPSPVSAPAPAAPAAPAPARGAQKPRGGPAARGGKYYARGAAKSGARAEEGNLNQNGIEDAPQDRKSQVDGRGRGGRGGSRGASRGGRGGRAFDKHSQTGKVDTEKRINQGWGAEEGNAELKAEEAAIKDASAEATPAGEAGDWAAPAGDAGEWGAPAAAADWTAPDGAAPAAGATDGAAKPDREGRPPRREREPEEEDNTLTLEQYLAQQKEKESSVVPKLEGVRKANEGADANIWKDVVALEKSDEDAYFVGKVRASPIPPDFTSSSFPASAEQSRPKARTKKEEKVFLDIEARFERPSRGGPRGGGRGGDDRGGRGRGGAGRGRGAPRGRPAGGNNAPAVNVDDETAFPSLS